MRKKNQYLELKNKHEAETNAFPMFFAFNNEQFEEGKNKLGVKDNSELLSIKGGGYIRKSDKDALKEMFNRHRNERKEAILSDKDGTGYICDMFRDELDNHEFGYTRDPSCTLMALGMTEKEIMDNPILFAAWNRAVGECIEWFDENY